MSDLKKIWPNIISTNCNEDKVSLEIIVPENLDYFKGHFPNVSILAGVVQLHWAVEYAKENFELNAFEVDDIEVLKFKDVIFPGQKLTLSFHRKSENKILFSYKSHKGLHASGRITLKDIT